MDHKEPAKIRINKMTFLGCSQIQQKLDCVCFHAYVYYVYYYWIKT